MIRIYRTTGKLKEAAWAARTLRIALWFSPMTRPWGASERGWMNAVLSSLSSLYLALGKKKEALTMLDRLLDNERQTAPSRALLQGLEARTHSEILVETGQVDALIAAIERGEAEYDLYKFEFNNGTPFIKGRAWLADALRHPDIKSSASVEKAKMALDEAYQRARDAGRVAFTAEALYLRAKWHSFFGEESNFFSDLNQACGSARGRGFNLLLTDLTILEADHFIRARDRQRAELALKQAQRMMQETGYRLRNSEIAQLQSALRAWN